MADLVATAKHECLWIVSYSQQKTVTQSVQLDD